MPDGVFDSRVIERGVRTVKRPVAVPVPPPTPVKSTLTSTSLSVRLGAILAKVTVGSKANGNAKGTGGTLNPAMLDPLTTLQLNVPGRPPALAVSLCLSG